MLDADALTAFQGAVGELGALAADRPLDPHAAPRRVPHALSRPRVRPGSSIPGRAAAAAAETSGAVVLLKGVPTVVARAGVAPITVAAGNPGLATGGSGDVLSGLVGASLAGGLAPEHRRGARRAGCSAARPISPRAG